MTISLILVSENGLRPANWRDYELPESREARKDFRFYCYADLMFQPKILPLHCSIQLPLLLSSKAKRTAECSIKGEFIF